MNLYLQSESTAARRRVYLHLVDASDGITPETGEAAGQPQISKNGAGFGNTSATLTAIGNGLYYVALASGELDTLGFFAVRFKSAATAEAQVLGQCVSFDPYDMAIQFADALLQRDIDNVEASAPVHSLAVAILKAVSRIMNDAGVLKVFQTDGSTLKLSQTITTNPDNAPVDELTAGT